MCCVLCRLRYASYAMRLDGSFLLASDKPLILKPNLEITAVINHNHLGVDLRVREVGSDTQHTTLQLTFRKFIAGLSLCRLSDRGSCVAVSVRSVGYQRERVESR